MRNSKQILLGLVAVLWLPAALGEADAPAETAAAPSESQQEARTLLMGMANFLAGRQAFSVKLVAGYDVVQASGQKIQFLEARDITLERPDRLRIEERVGAGGGNSVLFDGAKVTIWDADSGVYAQADQPGTIDDAVVYFVRDLGMRLPLAPLLMTRFPEELARRVRTVDYVELTEVFGEPAHHVAGRTDSVEFQVWIADGERPYPLRIVLTYDDPGQPQYWAQFSEWNLKPRLTSGTFAFKPPPDARQIVFAAQVPADSVPVEPKAAPGVTP
jgi:hypothetical protein